MQILWGQLRYWSVQIVKLYEDEYCHWQGQWRSIDYSLLEVKCSFNCVPQGTFTFRPQLVLQMHACNTFVPSLNVHKWATDPIKIFYTLISIFINFYSCVGQFVASSQTTSNVPRCSGKVRFICIALRWLTTEWHKGFLLGRTVCVGARVSSKFLLWSGLSVCSGVSWALDTSDGTSHLWVLQFYEL